MKRLTLRTEIDPNCKQYSYDDKSPRRLRQKVVRKCHFYKGRPRVISTLLINPHTIPDSSFGILKSINLSLFDLNPETTLTGLKTIHRDERPIPRDVIGAISFEMMIVVGAVASMNADRPLPENGKARLMLAANRIHAATQVVSL